MFTTQWKVSSSKIFLFLALQTGVHARGHTHRADVVCGQVGGSRTSLAFCCFRVCFDSVLPKNHPAIFPQGLSGPWDGAQSISRVHREHPLGATAEYFPQRRSGPLAQPGQVSEHAWWIAPWCWEAQEGGSVGRCTWEPMPASAEGRLCFLLPCIFETGRFPSAPAHNHVPTCSWAVSKFVLSPEREGHMDQ